jgi:hypothetical protein
MSARLRHVVLATGDLHDTLSRLRDEFDVAPGIADKEAMAEFGLAHEVLRLGETYLEVLSPLQGEAESTAARFLRRNGGDGGYMVDLQVPELDSTLGRMAAFGISPVLRDTYEGSAISQYHPRDFSTLLEVDQVDAPKDWHWDGHFADSISDGEVLGVVAVEIVTTDAEAMARRWSEVFELELDGTVVTTDNALVRFVAGASVGLASIDVAVRSPANVGKEVSVAGVRMRTVDQRGPREGPG